MFHAWPHARSFFGVPWQVWADQKDKDATCAYCTLDRSTAVLVTAGDRRSRGRPSARCRKWSDRKLVLSGYRVLPAEELEGDSV